MNENSISWMFRRQHCHLRMHECFYQHILVSSFQFSQRVFLVSVSVLRSTGGRNHCWGTVIVMGDIRLRKSIYGNQKLLCHLVTSERKMGKGYSPRHFDFKVLNKIEPLFFLFEFPQQTLISCDQN